jgi:hypothetical protein
MILFALIFIAAVLAATVSLLYAVGRWIAADDRERTEDGWGLGE